MTELVSARQRQLGFSLIELLIALTLGLLVSSAAIFMFLSSKQAFVTQEGMSEVQEGGRLAMRVLSTAVRYAGYTQDPQFNPTPSKLFTGTNQLPIQGVDNGKPPLAFYTNATTPDSDARTDTDVLVVNYYGNDDKRVTTCLGDAANTDTGTVTMVTNVFYLGPKDKTGLSNLFCYTIRDGNFRNEAIASGISNLQITYRVDSDGDSIADKYLTAADIEALATPNAVWRSVSAVQLLVTVSSANGVNRQATKDATLSDANGRILRTFSTAVAIRNAFLP